MRIAENKRTDLLSLWLLENRRHLAVIFLFAVGLPLVILSVALAIGEFNQELFMDFRFLMLPVEMFLIPWIIVNVIFFLQYAWDRDQNPEWKSLSIKITGVIIGSCIAVTLMEILYASRGIVDDDFIQMGDKQLSPTLTNYIEYTLGALVIGIPIFIRQSKRKALLFKLKEREFEVQKLNEMRTRAELSALQARINPHFLYNSLNSILSLIRSQPAQAEEMVMNLSKLFRFSLSSQQISQWTVMEEMEVVRTYMEIEKVRFSDKLVVEEFIDPSAENFAIPRFLIQPLMENAIKHGSSKVKEGRVKLHINLDHEKLYIRLYDNGPSFPENFPDGYGLQSTFEKLDLLFRNGYDVRFINGKEKHLEIILKKQADAGKL